MVIYMRRAYGGNIQTQDDLKKKIELKKKPTEPVHKIINFYEVIPKKYLNDVDNPNFNLHNIEIPFRMCVVAPSGSGKTNFVLNLIKVFSHGKGTFTDITIITANKDEPLYNWLEAQNDNIRILEGLNNNPKLDDYDKDYNHLLIWDDLMLARNLDDVEKYYIRARKKNVSLLFLAQSYATIPKNIRKNSNYLVLFDLGGSKREQNYILNEWSTDLDKDELRAIYNDGVKEHMNPLIIKGGKVDRNKKYRKGFLKYYDLDTFLKNIPRTLPKKKNNKVIEYCSSSDSE
jgi:hypothetical protein